MVRSLFDTVYNMNMAHLTRGRRTVFEYLAVVFRALGVGAASQTSSWP